MTTIETRTPGPGLRQRREARNLSVNKMRMRIARLVPERLLPTEEYFRRLETGETPMAAANPIVLAAVAEVYEIPLSELLDPELFAEIAAVADLLARSRCLSNEGTSGPMRPTTPTR